MPKNHLLFTALAVILIAAPAPLPASEPAVERDYLHTAHWHQDWEPCFTDRPADRYVAMRGMDVWIEFQNYWKAADPAEILKASKNITEAATAVLGSARMNQMIDDFESVANLDCSPGQSIMARFHKVGFGRIQADRIESLKWFMLAENPAIWTPN